MQAIRILATFPGLRLRGAGIAGDAGVRRWWNMLKSRVVPDRGMAMSRDGRRMRI